MRIHGSHTLQAPRERVWAALQDPQVLAWTIPGCRQLEETGDGVYAATVEAGVASITGTYTGEVALADLHEPDSYTLRAKGQGGPGTIDATARISLHDDGEEATRVEYEAEAMVGGAIAGVGQRVLTGVAKRNAAEFFAGVDRHLAGAPLREAAEEAPAVAGERAAAESAGAGQAGRQVYAGREPAPAAQPDQRWLLAAGLVGAAIALLGVLVGRRGAR